MSISVQTKPADFALPRRRPDDFARRKGDWRYGRIVYQVFLDRFAPSSRLESKQEHYAPPRCLREWDELPKRGDFLGEERNVEGELEFWGGDLESLMAKLDYIQSLKVETLYLNPIFEAFTNHKYDALDYFRVDPQYGSNEELRVLAEELHRRGMRLILDGVFNHMGRRSDLFRRALSSPGAPEREFFTFDEKARNGYLGWRNSANLPELKLETEEVRRLVYAGKDSVVQTWLRDFGIDGWRLDVAPDIGPQYLNEITRAVHEVRADAVTIGECWNYPEEWLHVLDGIMNMHLRKIVLDFCSGNLRPARAARLMETMAADAGIEGLLRSHLVLDNHDTPRLRHVIPNERRRRLAWLLHFTLPGCPVVYYGSELGMDGGKDPENRAPMRWDLLTETNDDFSFVQKIIELRCNNPALIIGDWRVIEADEVLAYLRLTADPRETILVVVNPQEKEVNDLIQIRDSRLMDAQAMECLCSGSKVSLQSGFVQIALPALSACILRSMDQGHLPGYSALKRFFINP